MIAKDGEVHTSEVDATSLFEAADTFIRDHSRLWWWSTSAIIEIESGQDRWHVNQDTIRKWIQAKKKRTG